MASKTTSTIIFLLVMTIAGCNINSSVSKKRLSGYWPLRQGFEVSLISVDSFNAEGIPVKYKEETTIIGVYHRDTTILKQSADPDTYWEKINRLSTYSNVDKRNKGKRKINFYEPNTSFGWWKIPIQENELVQTLPLEFAPGYWYKFSHLYPQTEILKKYEVFMFVEEDGSSKEICHYIGYYPGSQTIE